MVVIPPGTFRMGANAGEEGRPEGPVRHIKIRRPFALGAYEITNAQYARFLASTGRAPSKGCRSLKNGKVESIPEADFRQPGFGAGGGAPDLPVVCVSWKDATAYADWLSAKSGKRYRLPTEAEWEYAARAGGQGEYYWGNLAEDACANANVFDRDGAEGGTVAVFSVTSAGEDVPHAKCRDGHAGVAPVGSYRPNAFGLYDMTGNVWEWTQDCYVAPYADAAPRDGRAYEVTGACPRRAVRGGSWMSTPFRNRSSWRGRDPEELVTWIFGFRVARDVSKKSGK